MILKLLIICVCLVLAKSSKLPHIAIVGGLREAFETEDAFYLPISNQGAEHLRLPAAAVELTTLSLANEHRTSTLEPLIHNGPALVEPFVPSPEQNQHNRVRQRALPSNETEDISYHPISANLELQDTYELGDLTRVAAHLQHVSNDISLPVAIQSLRNYNRQKRQVLRRNSNVRRLHVAHGFRPNRRSGPSGSIERPQPMFRSQSMPEQGFRNTNRISFRT